MGGLPNGSPPGLYTENHIFYKASIKIYLPYIITIATILQIQLFARYAVIFSCKLFKSVYRDKAYSANIYSLDGL